MANLIPFHKRMEARIKLRVDTTQKREFTPTPNIFRCSSGSENEEQETKENSMKTTTTKRSNTKKKKIIFLKPRQRKRRKSPSKKKVYVEENEFEVGSVKLREKKFYVRNCKSLIVFQLSVGVRLELYEGIYRYFNSKGISVYVFDSRYCSKRNDEISEDDEIDYGMNNIGILGKDLEYVLRFRVSEAFKNIFVLSQSVGNTVVLDLEIRKSLVNIDERIRGLICFSSYIVDQKMKSDGWFSYYGGKLWSRIVSGKNGEVKEEDESYFRKRIGSEKVRKLVQDKRMMRRINNEKMIGNKSYSDKDLKKIQIPIFFVHSFQDKVAPIQRMLDTYNKISSKEKAMKIYQEHEHELFLENEDVRKKVVNGIWKWIHLRLMNN